MFALLENFGGMSHYVHRFEDMFVLLEISGRMSHYVHRFADMFGN
jgi:hypothetical protein